MSQKNDSSEVKSEAKVVDTLFDVGSQWATTGLNLAKTALEETSKALAKTAKSLETLAERLSPKKSA